MIKNVYTNTAVSIETTKEVTEYKLGNTTYKVVTRFNFSGENLKNILARLIKKEVQKSA